MPRRWPTSPTVMAEHPAGRIGPNAITRIAEALGPAAPQVFAAARLSHHLVTPPTRMVPEVDVAALHAALYLRADAEAVAAEAGRLTAEYLLANRIPGLAQSVLRLLPARPALRLLCRAIAAHAWTFAGSGRFSYAIGRMPELRLEGAPFASPSYPAAVFQRLFEVLVAKGTTVHPVGAGFRVVLPGRAARRAATPPFGSRTPRAT